MAGMKKSGAKKRSARSIEQEQQRIAEETAAREAAERKSRQRAKLMSDSKVIMLSIYGLAFGIISWLMDYMGVVALIALVLSILGLRVTDKVKTKTYYYCAWGGIVLSVSRLALWAYLIITYFAR